ncbi:hypothetical protein [Methylorubrum extorquens]
MEQTHQKARYVKAYDTFYDSKMTEAHGFAISCLLQRHKELQEEAATIKLRMATIQVDVEGIERVLDSLGYEGELPNRSCRTDCAVLSERASRLHP